MKKVSIGKGERRFKTYNYTDKEGNKTTLETEDIIKYRGLRYKIILFTIKKTSRHITRRAYLKPFDSKENRIGIIRKGKIDSLEESCFWSTNSWAKRSWVYEVKV